MLKILKFQISFISFISLLVIVVLSAIIQWPYMMSVRLDPDEALYAWYAIILNSGNNFLFSPEIIEFHPPLFAALLAAGYKVYPSEFTFRFIGFIVSQLGILLIYYLGRKLAGRFIGLFCAIHLAFNYVYMSQATHISMDCLLIVLLLCLAITLLRVKKFQLSQEDFWVGLVGLMTILTKWAGILAIPLTTMSYFLIFPRANFYQLSKKFLPVVGVMILGVTILYVNNMVQVGYVGSFSALKGRFLIRPFWYYLGNLHNFMVVPYLIPLLFLGLWTGIQSKDRKRLFVALWFLMVLFSVSIVREKSLQYGLLLLPPGVLLAGLGLDRLIHMIGKSKRPSLITQGLCFFIAIMTCGIFYPRTKQLLDRSFLNFTGFEEAASWIKDEHPASVVMAGSARAMRYYIGLDFIKKGGMVQGLPQSREDFLKVPGAVIFETDYWERIQPSWIFPLTSEKLEYLEDHGFKLRKIVYRPAVLPDGRLKEIPVIWIFVKEAVV